MITRSPTLAMANSRETNSSGVPMQPWLAQPSSTVEPPWIATPSWVSRSRTPPSTLSPRAKMQNYINLVLADLEVKAQNPEAQAILLDANGNLAEGRGSNVFFVRDGVLLTPKERYVLPGVSRQTAVDLARELGIPVEEADLDFYDAVTADEAFITSSMIEIIPIVQVDEAALGNGQPGPVTTRLQKLYGNAVKAYVAARRKPKRVKR